MYPGCQIKEEVNQCYLPKMGGMLKNILPLFPLLLLREAVT